jgi:hypothetical protein
MVPKNKILQAIKLFKSENQPQIKKRKYKTNSKKRKHLENPRYGLKIRRKF